MSWMITHDDFVWVIADYGMTLLIVGVVQLVSPRAEHAVGDREHRGLGARRARADVAASRCTSTSTTTICTT